MEKKIKKLTTRQIALNGIAAGLYAAITVLTASFSYGPIQFRIADALCLLVCLEPSLCIGLTLGCLVANLFSTVTALDLVIGTAATLLGCVLTLKLKKTWLLPLPTVLCNALLVGAMLAWVTGSAFGKVFLLYAAQVAAGELVVLYVLGIPLYLALQKTDFIPRILKK